MKSTQEILLEKYGNSDKDIILDGADIVSQQGYTLIPNYALHNHKISGNAKLVYALLLSYAWGEKNSVFPGQEKLAEDCGCSLRTITTAIQELKNNKFVSILRRGQGKTNLYVLHFIKR
jgi:biotin operon repressor